MAKKPTKQNLKPVTQAKEWKKRTDTGSLHYPLELPSGNVCLVQPLGLEKMMTDGLIPNTLLQPMLSAIEVSAASVKGGPKAEQLARKKMEEQLQKAQQELIQSPDSMKGMFEMANAVTLATVVEPKILPVPEDASDRDPDLLYVDEIDLDDKMFIFSHAVSGVRDVESFRDEVAQHVAAVSGEQAVEQATQRVAPAE